MRQSGSQYGSQSYSIALAVTAGGGGGGADFLGAGGGGGGGGGGGAAAFISSSVLGRQAGLCRGSHSTGTAPVGR